MVRLALAGLLGLAIAAQPAALAVRDIDGHSWTPLAPAAGDAHLLIFVSIDCPISARYSPEINRILHDYTDKRVRAWLVYVDPKVEAAAVRSNLREYHAG